MKWLGWVPWLKVCVPWSHLTCNLCLLSKISFTLFRSSFCWESGPPEVLPTCAQAQSVGEYPGRPHHIITWTLYTLNEPHPLKPFKGWATHCILRFKPFSIYLLWGSMFHTSSQHFFHCKSTFSLWWYIHSLHRLYRFRIISKKSAE